MILAIAALTFGSRRRIRSPFWPIDCGFAAGRSTVHTTKNLATPRTRACSVSPHSFSLLLITNGLTTLAETDKAARLEATSVYSLGRELDALICFATQMVPRGRLSGQGLSPVNYDNLMLIIVACPEACIEVMAIHICLFAARRISVIVSATKRRFPARDAASTPTKFSDSRIGTEAHDDPSLAE